MRRRQRWFLPETPDLLGMLGKQLAITVEGMQALVAWAGGDAAAVDRLRDCEHRADDSKRELRAALTTAFITPLEPEDLFELSRGLDRMLNNAKNAVREAEVMQAAPDDAIAQMAAELADGVAHLSDAFVALGSGAGPRRARHRGCHSGRQEPEPAGARLPTRDVGPGHGRRLARSRREAGALSPLCAHE